MRLRQAEAYYGSVCIWLRWLALPLTPLVIFSHPAAQYYQRLIPQDIPATPTGECVAIGAPAHILI